MTPREAKSLLAVGVLVAVPLWLSSEQVTLSTTYPSPAGIYAQLITTGSGGKNTVLARDGGNVILAPPSNASGAVGIGLTNPSAKLSVAGGVSATGAVTAGGAVSAGGQVSAGGAVTAAGVVRVGNLSSEPSGANGAIYYNTAMKKFRAFQDGQWIDLAAPSGPTSGQLYGGCKVAMAGSMPAKFNCFDVTAPAYCSVSPPATSPTMDCCKCQAGYTPTVTGQWDSGGASGPTYACRKD